jgi:hypothetical protein
MFQRIVVFVYVPISVLFATLFVALTWFAQRVEIGAWVVLAVAVVALGGVVGVRLAKAETLRRWMIHPVIRWVLFNPLDISPNGPAFVELRPDGVRTNLHRFFFAVHIPWADIDQIAIETDPAKGPHFTWVRLRVALARKPSPSWPAQRFAATGLPTPFTHEIALPVPDEDLGLAGLRAAIDKLIGPERGEA